ncbi:MAG: 50S ribosomal protein L3 [Spirochaetes bacterium]|nr:50S ribosomal protein L3 [Spirochaetota bacterium]MBN2769122.1 50S ribosomal protein L3 [Spirochaetota bacterium]HRX15372.1 50S ribosomal protein L3 [Spirochaetota bacterium]
MKKALVGKKISMTQVYDENGVVVPVTVIELGPNVVLQKKTVEKDGYSALKVGFGSIKEKNCPAPLLKDFKKKSVEPKRVLREIDAFDESLDVGSVIDCSVLDGIEKVNIVSTSKGKGFAGSIKRHGFGGGRATHGSHFHRAPGSIGACAYPGEVWKGQRMPGRKGSDRVTVKNLKVVKVIKDKNLVLVSGAVPGRKDSIVLVCES